MFYFQSGCRKIIRIITSSPTGCYENAGYSVSESPSHLPQTHVSHIQSIYYSQLPNILDTSEGASQRRKKKKIPSENDMKMTPAGSISAGVPMLPTGSFPPNVSLASYQGGLNFLASPQGALNHHPSNQGALNLHPSNQEGLNILGNMAAYSCASCQTCTNQGTPSAQTPPNPPQPSGAPPCNPPGVHSTSGWSSNKQIPIISSLQQTSGRLTRGDSRNCSYKGAIFSSDFHKGAQPDMIYQCPGANGLQSSSDFI